MKENGLGRLFVRQVIMAVPWGIIFLIVLFVAFAGMKQQIKESVQYTVRTTIHETAAIAFDPRIVVAVKQNVKEGIEFVAKTAREEVQVLLNDSQLKQDIKETLEYSGEKFRK